MAITTFPTGVKQTSNLVKAVSDSVTLTEADHGTIVFMSGADKVVTLPYASVDNVGLTFTIATSVTSGSTGLSIAPGRAADIINWNSATANVNLVNTAATDAVGDYVTVVCTSLNNWYPLGSKGIWTKAS